MNKHGRIGGQIEVGVLAPLAVLPKLPAVIAPKADNGVVCIAVPANEVRGEWGCGIVCIAMPKMPCPKVAREEWSTLQKHMAMQTICRSCHGYADHLQVMPWLCRPFAGYTMAMQIICRLCHGYTDDLQVMPWLCRPFAGHAMAVQTICRLCHGCADHLQVMPWLYR